jgi:hypothetical protein
VRKLGADEFNATRDVESIADRRSIPPRFSTRRSVIRPAPVETRYAAVDAATIIINANNADPTPRFNLRLERPPVRSLATISITGTDINTGQSNETIEGAIRVSCSIITFVFGFMMSLPDFNAVARTRLAAFNVSVHKIHRPDRWKT